MFLLLLPTRFFSLREGINFCALFFDLTHFEFVFLLGLGKSAFGFGYQLLSSLAGFLSGGFFLLSRDFTSLVFPLESKCSFARGFGLLRWRSIYLERGLRWPLLHSIDVG